MASEEIKTRVTRFGEVTEFAIEGWTTEEANVWKQILSGGITKKAFGALENYANVCAQNNSQSMNLLTQEGTMMALKRQGIVMGIKIAIEFLTEGLLEDEKESEQDE